MFDEDVPAASVVELPEVMKVTGIKILPHLLLKCGHYSSVCSAGQTLPTTRSNVWELCLLSETEGDKSPASTNPATGGTSDVTHDGRDVSTSPKVEKREPTIPAAILTSC